MTTTPGGLLLVLSILVPFVGVIAGFVLGGRWTRRIAFAVMAAGIVIALAIAQAYLTTGGPVVYLLGGWAPPLGVALRADALAVAMLALVAVVVIGIGIFAWGDFATPVDATETRAPFAFWLLLLAVWGSLNLVFVSGDLFTLYVALELLTFAGVPLVCLDGRGETLRSALRYMLYALAGSVLYLLGAVLTFGACGTLDIALLAQRVQPGPVTWTALTLMTVGLFAKTALFPLHLWLPPAHAGAPPAASAVLSALVVKGSFFIVVRLWFDAMPALPGPVAAQIVGVLGAAAILFGNVIALRQERLKLLIAYSTLAQIGYLFLMFPLAYDAASGTIARVDALAGGIMQAMSHATAKAAMFMAAGTIYAALGHDRIGELTGAARAVPLAVLAFAVGGVALMGIVPGGAYVAKKLLLYAADAGGQWWWDVVLTAGGMLTTGYVVLVLAQALRRADAPVAPRARVATVSQLAALALAVASHLLALAAVMGPLPAELLASPFAPKELGSIVLTLAMGALAAFGIGRAVPAGALARLVRPLRGGLAGFGATLARIDFALRQWTVAGISLLALTLLVAATMAGFR